MKIKPAETHSRSIAKAASYRALSVLIDFIVAYFFTRSAVFSVGIVVLVDSYSTILYYLHERIWARVRWGRRSV